MEYHELANFYPMQSDEVFNELVEGMKLSGYRKEFPIVTYENKILDGRNRYKAAKIAKVDPVLVAYNGDDPVSFVMQANSNRRDLTAGQRVAIATKLVKSVFVQKGLENKRIGGKVSGKQLYPNLGKAVRTGDEVAKFAGVSKGTVANVDYVEKRSPEIFEQIASGELSAHAAKKKVRTMEIATERAELAKSAKDIKPSNRWQVFQADMRTWQSEKQYDFIITDPPYLKEYKPLYGVLAERANEWLKDGGLLIAMAGQSYLDELYEMMSKHLDYYWTASYLTPGQPTPLRQKNVNTTWKPLLIYSKGDYKGKIFGDVFTSKKNEKAHHKWGQSESGMYDISSKICHEAQSILDPFCGAGTTGIAAKKHGCLFTGLELDIENVNISKARIHDTQA